ncbi:glycosyltransferase family 2 protein [Mariniblastus fucicola]|uniref:Undecaprenyl-phosphate 4-deoxy-4-formamido-L-arabinose transferase n=1 Tax=Mariniblastus fucicola TaxID=980251 RepID=A0A5B9PCZ1_9BACT|nr:glycosyltransferase family 2 protein [Mariniblastus fucicola]QEG24164.1 Undecaprenyl-phosphate 4-deoxy-4-formamido-L-arabinose transferase [Mariniblastus fucicola]
MNPALSFVIPALNEEDSIEQLHSEILDVCEKNNLEFEIVFVDDGSRDSTWPKIQQLCRDHDSTRAIRFRQNFGKAAALRAGAAETKNPLIVTMDADLQDDPAEVPNLLEKLNEGFDVVSGWKQVRNDPLGKTLPSKVFNKLVSWLTGVKLQDHNCGFKVYRREVFDEVKLYGEMHRFVPVLAAARGFRIAQVAVNHRARQFGVSKYGLTRLPKGFLDLLTVSFLTGFNHRPQHVLGFAGLISFSLGFLGVAWMSIYWVLRMTMFEDWEPVHRRPILLYSFGGVLLGAQLLCMGFLAELIVAKNADTQIPYSITERED